MKKRWVDSLPVVVAALAALVIGGGTLMAQSNVDYIQGRVTSGSGTAEAGVWVIAQTNSLGTPYRKIVVTDDNGAFVIPRLPRATYDVWVRGYGIRDTKKISASPGTESLSLRTQVAGRAEAARWGGATGAARPAPPGAAAAGPSGRRSGSAARRRTGRAPPACPPFGCRPLRPG